MADPTSAAGFAVGVISLGIQVCQGLVSYYADWKSRDDDIDRILDKLRGLGETLENLKSEILKLQDSNAKEIKDVNTKILSCDAGIHRLQTVLNKCCSSPSANSVHNFFQKTIYPFKKATLQELDASVKDLQGNLDTGLLSLLLRTANDNREGLHVLISNSREEFNEVRHEIQNTAAEVRGVTSRFENLQSYQQNHLPALNDRMETIEVLLRKMWKDQFRRNIEGLSDLGITGSQSTLAMQNSARSFQARLIEKPSLLRAAHDEITRSGDVPLFSSMTEYRAYNPSLSNRYLKSRICCCSSSTHSSEHGSSNSSQPRGSIWGARFKSSAVIHRKGCPLSPYAEKEKSWKLRIVYCGRLVAQAVTMSIGLRWGAGGYSITPSLFCNRVVSSDSPIFRLIEDNISKSIYMKGATLTEHVDILIRSIEQLYQDGKASVHDVDEEGNNIVHKYLESYDIFDITEGFPIENLRLIKRLSDWGVRLNRVNASGLTCLDLWCSMWSDLVQRFVNMAIKGMVNLGAEFVHINEYHSTMFAENARQFDEFAEACDFNDMCRAVLRRSESELRKVLQYSRDLIDEPSARGLRPLHLSVGWPRGIEVLLNYGADLNVTDEDGYYPVDHAIRICPESLALLGEADCALRPRSLDLAIVLALFHDGDRAKSVIIAGYIIRLEANQRRKLQALLSHHLPGNSICIHSHFENKVLDAHIGDAVAALEQHGVSIPFSLQGYKHNRGTVYHILGIPLEMLTFLWDAGFRDINEPYPDGRTPITLPGVSIRLENSLERINWFIDKGVNPDQKVQHIHQNSRWECNSEAGCSCLKSGHAVTHYLAFIIAQNSTPLSKGEILSLFLRFQTLLQSIFNDENQDRCMCACSSAGCRAINIIIKGVCDIFSNFLSHPAAQLLLAAAISETTVSEILRSLTFHALGLTHTCCRRSQDWMGELPLTPFEDEDDISEIHEEERDDLHLLEHLLLEFDRRRRDSPSSLWEFLSGYWSYRMQRVLREEESTNVSAEEESPDVSAEEESSDVSAEEESPDEDESRKTKAGLETFSYQDHRMT